MPQVFMRARWENLLMVNFSIDPEHLEPFVPKGTEIELFQGRPLVSIVGFHFLNSRAWGIPLFFHQRFEEVNLRFYVRRQVNDEWRSGVVFVKEIVPRWAWSIAFGARTLYRENYVAMPMKSQVAVPGAIRFDWKFEKRWNSVSARTVGDSFIPEVGHPGNYVTEHYWGYAKQRDGSTLEYQVEHPPWKLWECDQINFDCDVLKLYGPSFESALKNSPHSAYIVEGSDVLVRTGVKIA